jgi:lantibiotic transport system ATP-binding protein
MAVRAEKVSFSYGSHKALGGVDVRADEASILAVLGPNGSGKTTLIRILLGLLEPDAGDITVLGYPPGSREALRRTGVLIEAPALYGHLTARENLKITCLLKEASLSEIDRTLEIVHLKDAANTRTAAFSQGMKQRLGIALALVGDPSLLFLDEPTNALDPSGILEIRELVRSLPETTGATVFFSSHNLAEVERVADQLLVLKDGGSHYLGSMEGYGRSTDATARARVARPDKAAQILRERGLSHVVQEDALEVCLQGTSIEGLAELLVLGGCGLREIGLLKRSLEEKYHEQMD